MSSPGHDARSAPIKGKRKGYCYMTAVAVYRLDDAHVTTVPLSIDALVPSCARLLAV